MLVCEPVGGWLVMLTCLSVVQTLIMLGLAYACWRRLGKMSAVLTIVSNHFIMAEGKMFTEEADTCAGFMLAVMLIAAIVYMLKQDPIGTVARKAKESGNEVIMQLLADDRRYQIGEKKKFYSIVYTSKLCTLCSVIGMTVYIPGKKKESGRPKLGSKLETIREDMKRKDEEIAMRKKNSRLEGFIKLEVKTNKEEIKNERKKEIELEKPKPETSTETEGEEKEPGKQGRKKKRKTKGQQKKTAKDQAEPEPQQKPDQQSEKKTVKGDLEESDQQQEQEKHDTDTPQEKESTSNAERSDEPKADGDEKKKEAFLRRMKRLYETGDSDVLSKEDISLLDKAISNSSGIGSESEAATFSEKAKKLVGRVIQRTGQVWLGEDVEEKPRIIQEPEEKQSTSLKTKLDIERKKVCDDEIKNLRAHEIELRKLSLKEKELDIMQEQNRLKEKADERRHKEAMRKMEIASKQPAQQKKTRGLVAQGSGEDIINEYAEKTGLGIQGQIDKDVTRAIGERRKMGG